MGYSVLFTLIIVLFASPILGALLGIIGAHTRFTRLGRCKSVFPILTTISALLIFIEMVTNKTLNSVEILFPSFQTFDIQASFLLDFNRVFTILTISLGILLMHWVVKGYHKDLRSLTGEFVKHELEVRKDRILLFSNLVLFAFMLMSFSSSDVCSATGLILISIAFLLIDEKGNPGKFNLFRINIISDFVIIFSLVLFMSLSSKNEYYSGISVVVLFIALLFKIGIPSVVINRNIKQHELRVLFSSLVRPTLVLILLQRMVNIFFSNSVLGFIIISLIILIILIALISLFRSSDSLNIIDKVSIFGSLGLFLFSIHGHFETVIMAYIAVITGIIVQSFVFLILSNRTETIFKDLDTNQRFNLDTLGGLRNKLLILYLLFIISSLSIAGALPFVGGWSNFYMYLHLTSNCPDYRAFIHIIAFIGFSFVSILFIFVQAKIGTFVFSRNYRGSVEHFSAMKLPNRFYMLPGIFITLIILIGGILNLPGNAEISGILSGLFTSTSGITNEVNINLFKKISDSDHVVMIVLLLIPLFVYITSLIRHKTLEAMALRNNNNSHLDLSLILRKADSYLNLIADFVYTVIERLLFHSIFTLSVRFLVYVKNILTFNFQSDEQLHKNKSRFVIAVFILVIVIVAVVIGVVW